MANVHVDTVSSIDINYHLFLPNGTVWVFDSLIPGAFPINKMGSLWAPTAMVVPLDLITAARLRLIKPGDDSGIGEEQWAWIRLIGLTGESA